MKQPRGSAHKIENAQRFHKNRGRVPRFLYFWRAKVSEQELSDDSCSARAEHTLSGKTKFFRQSLKYSTADRKMANETAGITGRAEFSAYY